MPEGLSSEEKSVWIYMKLCKLLRYDDSKIFNDVRNDLSTEFLQNVKPNSKVICFDFARIYAKFVNGLQDIEAKVVGGDKHFFVVVLGENIVTKAEATNAILMTNEFFKVKMGLHVEGLAVLVDEKEIVQSSINRFSKIIYKDVKTLGDYIDMLDVIRENESEEDEIYDDVMAHKLECIVKVMHEKGISGMEALQGIMKFTKIGAFGGNVKNVWIKSRFFDDEGKKNYKSCMAVYRAGEEKKVYVVDTDTMIVEQFDKEDLLERFKDGQYEYKDERYSIGSLDEELGTGDDKQELGGDTEK